MKKRTSVLVNRTATALWLVGAALAAPLPAGTQIVNQAVADFLDPTTKQPIQVSSNRVITTVQAVCSVSLAPLGTVQVPGQQSSVLAGEQAVFRYTVTNAGNQAETFPLVARTEQPSAFTPTVQVYLDANGNGQVDTGESAVKSVLLAPDASAKLLLVAQTAPGQAGDAHVNLLTSCGGQETPAAVSRVRVGAPPALNVNKSFEPILIKPGTQTTVTVTASNDTATESREVILTDPLEEQLAAGLSYVPGSAQASAGTLEYTSDGQTWTATPGAVVKGIRVRVPKLAPQQSVTLSFKLLAGATAEGKEITNTASALTSGLTVSGSAKANVKYQPKVALGPVDNPEAPEDGPADRQTKPFAVVGQQVCFDHTLKNTGDVQDAFTVTVSYPTGGATPQLLDSAGQPLVQPIKLEAGASTTVRVCHTPTLAGPLEALLTVNGERGTRNTTRDLISQVETGLPELKKAVSASTVDENGKVVPVPEGAAVAVGDTLTYTLTVRNPYTRPLSGVVISDPLPAHTDFVSASTGGQVSGAAGQQTVTWTLGSLAPSETRTLTVVAKVSSRVKDGDTLANLFQLVTSELPPQTSNTVNTPVWNAKLAITKEVSSQEVTAGDRVTYTLRIRNTSTTTDIVQGVVTDEPTKGLQYIAGTSTLAGKAIADPELSAGKLRWPVAVIPANGEIVITYDMRITPEAQGELINVVSVVGSGRGSMAKAIASNRASAKTKLSPLKFAPLGDIVGYVFVDRNRNGLYEPGVDTPVERARVLLAGGRSALTDPKGRYSFANVPYGAQALRLDPSSSPYPPLKVPEDGGVLGTRLLQVNGLHALNFPLAPLGGDIAAQRQTSLLMGEIRVDKRVVAEPGGYRVELKINTPRELSDFQLDDPLPAGASLRTGQNSLNQTLPPGETVLSYQFAWSGEPGAALTDPVVSWRY